MKSYIKPQTKVGKWSFLLLLAFFFLLLLTNLIVRIQGSRAEQTLISNVLISVPAVLAVLCGISAFCAGVVSIWKKKERAVLVYIATFLGFMVFYFLVGEILSPH